jgi:ankyrin repeat protein/predicted DsbA family dithiol-disulfide isomerase
MRPRDCANTLPRPHPIGQIFAEVPAAATSCRAENFTWRRTASLTLKLARGLALMGMLFIPVALSTAWAAEAPIDLHAAVRAGDMETVEAALKSGADVNSPDNWGRTPLIVALQQRKAPVVEMLINRGASAAATDAWGRTPLLVATQLKNTAAIRLLLEKKSDVNAANKNDITPLISAAQTGNQEAATMLLAAGASPDRQDNLGWTALMWAAYRKDDAIVKLLLANGADAAKEGRDKSTALELAKGRGADPSIIALLAAKTPSAPSIRTNAAADRAKQPKPVTTAAAQKLSPAIDTNRIVRGNPKAAITIFEYTDFQCPYCRYGALTVDEVMARYEGQVRLIVKQLPLPLLHPVAMSCALYFEAISMQSADKAWAFYDRIFLDQRDLAGGEPYLQKVAAELGVDMKKLEQDLHSQTAHDRIAADLKESEQYRFDGVPAFIVNGEVIEGAQPPQRFFELIDAAQRQ